jgi:NDP-sugar pyrophosphorylase family protein
VAILCGGLGTRLLPATSTIPKALVEVNGEPFIFHQLRLLKSRGAGRIVLCTGYLGEMIEAAVGSGEKFGLTIAYSPDGPLPLGTAGALRKALPLLGSAFLVLNGDSYLDCDYAAVWNAFQESGKSGLMTVYENEGDLAPSNVEFVNGMVLAYQKDARTPRMRHIDYGLSAYRAAALEDVPLNRPADLAEVNQRLIAKRDMIGFEVAQRFYEIGSASALSETEAFLARAAKLRQ